MKPTEGYDIIENFGMNKPTEEKTFLRILVDSNMNNKLYIFEQWDGRILYRGIFKCEGNIMDDKGMFKRIQYKTHNKYEAKIMMGLLGLNKIKRYYLYHHLNGDLMDCLIEFED